MSFSADLRHITILTSLVRVNQQESDFTSPCSISVQDLLEQCDCNASQQNDHSPEPVGDCACPFGWHHFMSASCTVDPLGDYSPEPVGHCTCQFLWHDFAFSPTAKYLLMVTAPGKLGEGIYDEREFRVFEDKRIDSLNFVAIAKTKTLIDQYAQAGIFMFHPYEPLLVISRLAVTVLWFFGEKGPYSSNLTDGMTLKPS